MLISVILPVYNVSQYLSQCLDSIISQPYKELEIICINDASTDGSKEILDKYAQKDNRIKVFENSENLGAGLSRNRGLKLAKGEYVHFVDPDDWLEEDLYTKIYPKISEFSNPDIIYFNYNTYDNITKEVKPTKFKNKRIINQILNPLKNTEAFDNWDRYAWIKLQRRLFLIENNIFYTSSKALEEMIPAAITYTKCQSLVYTDITGINYRINREGSLVSTGYKSIKEIVKAFLYNKKLYKHLPDNIKYKLLGFDYYQIRHNIEKAYLENDISTPELIRIIRSVNSKDTKKYIYTELESDEYELYINLRKIIMLKYCPKLWKKLIKLKKRLCKNSF